MNAPCFNCTKRCANCHSECKAYSMYRYELVSMKQQIESSKKPYFKNRNYFVSDNHGNKRCKKERVI